ncbi:ethylbenzene dehydrogenase-related protein [Roseomonas fluvialis]|uniref:Cytochrome c-552/DMSO reductase-like haem-binding domain-containing protein n=1 Tax=Roseomonas fluvialis TaxID=1750527 RepID=A0ABN6P0D7_9PROT|nr:ethylbenzene dehydrogenase-related protein [Roseomonas fluvialis]BDG71745.1 hypothetical protein Rmf_16740 [Roseomonas fluvialis]
MRRIGLVSGLVVFGGALGLSWWTHGSGVVRDDPSRHISIPQALTVPLTVQVAHNGTDVWFRYRWPAPNAGIFHDMLRFDGTAWQVRGGAAPGSNPDGLHEDRVSMMLDDGSVPEFGRYGGYFAIGDRLAGFTVEASGREIAAHPELGRRLGLDEATKYLPATRSNAQDWSSVVPEAEQRRLQAAGYFLDLWHWRAARSNPMGVADDQFITAGRLSDAGRGAYATNWDGANRRPQLMFDPARAGRTALRWDDVVQGRVGQDDVNALRPDLSAPFDPSLAWQEGDTLPRRILRAPQASRADIAVAGRARWADGFWDVTLRRRMDTGQPQEDKILRDGGVYQAAFAIHRQATGGRWHYVSLPFSVGLGREADIVATRFEGEAPGWQQPANAVTLFYPGQVNWPLIISERHPGADRVRAGVPVRFRHSEDQLAHYGVEMEFREAIRHQWLLTLAAGVALIAAFGFALTSTIGRGRSA